MLLLKSKIIANQGYSVQEHSVTKTDGYILTMQRIPHGKSGANPTLGRPVYIQHGIFKHLFIYFNLLIYFLIKDFLMFRRALSSLPQIAHWVHQFLEILYEVQLI